MLYGEGDRDDGRICDRPEDKAGEYTAVEKTLSAEEVAAYVATVVRNLSETICCQACADDLLSAADEFELLVAPEIRKELGFEDQHAYDGRS